MLADAAGFGSSLDAMLPDTFNAHHGDRGRSFLKIGLALVRGKDDPCEAVGVAFGADGSGYGISGRRHFGSVGGVGAASAQQGDDRSE